MTRTAHAIASLLLAVAAAGCGDEGGVSSTDTKRDASFVLRADLKPGMNGGGAGKLVRSWIDLAGVARTRGDAGKHVWIYGQADATVREMNAVRSTVEADKHVAEVIQVR